jgi:hypothetical protein
MIIRCPRCGRDGNAPESRGRLCQKVRCRPCGARFFIDHSPGVEEPRYSEGASTTAPRPHVRERPRVTVERVSDTDDFELTPFSLRSLPDSKHDMSTVLGGDPDDSQVELPAFSSSDEPSGEVEAAAPFESASSEFALAVPWHYKYIESWGRVHFYVAVGFAASSLSVLGWLLVSAMVVGQGVSSSITALIVGCVGTIAFLLLSLSATVLIILLVDVARNVRVLIQQFDRNPVQAIDTKSQRPTTLSQPAG